MANFVKFMDAEGQIVGQIEVGASSESKKTFTNGCMALLTEGADVVKIAYPKSTPEAYLKVEIKGIAAAMFPKANIFESAVFEWEKTSFGGAEVDFSSPDYWYSKGYEPSKDPNGEFRRAVEAIFKKVDEVASKAVKDGVIGKSATLAVYFQSNFKGKKKENGYLHTFPLDDAYRSKF